MVGVVELKVKTAPHVQFGGMTRQVESGVNVVGCTGLNGATRDGAVFDVIDLEGETGIGQEAAGVVCDERASGSDAAVNAR